MSEPKIILVTGATGKQGGAVIRSLLALPSFPQQFRIIALTRSIKSRSAQALLLLSSVPNAISLVEGDLDDFEKVFENLDLRGGRRVWGVFSVQAATPGTDGEERWGKGVVDACIVNGVGWVVYSSSDRGGPIVSPDNPTEVGNFTAKYNIEKYLMAKVEKSGSQMGWTILRPVTFMENLSADRHGAGFARMWEQMGTKKLQLVSTNDIGWFAAQAFAHPEEYRNKAISLAGDELTQPEAGVIFKDVVGKDMAMAPCLIGSALKYVIKELGPMFDWFEKHGYGADVAECKRVNPGMQDLRAWVRDSSGFVKA